jgi:hypothetical protein
MNVTNRNRAMLTGLLWLGRILTVLVFLFWGAFFVEHLVEWFAHPVSNPPPFQVWIAQALHFLMLAGLAVALRWQRIGGVVVAVAGLLFLVRAGANFPVFYAMTLLPTAILVISRWAIRRTSLSTVATVRLRNSTSSR